jgi:hypothetical protein
MIETIEKVRTQPFSGTTFQFFAPGINKQVYNTTTLIRSDFDFCLSLCIVFGDF